MKKIFLLSFLTVILAGCGQKNTRYSTPGKVLITGKVNNPDTETNKLNVTLFSLGFEPKQLSVPVDTAGIWGFECDTYAPLSVSIQALSTLSLVTFPNDNIHVEFDGNTRNPQKFFNSLKISGDRAKTNMDIAAFYFLYYTDPVLPMRGKVIMAMKNDTPEQYLQLLDGLQQRWDTLYDTFVETYSPDNEAKKWVKTYIDAQYANHIGEYCMELKNNVHYGEREFPETFREKMLNFLPLSEDMFIDVNSINAYTQIFTLGYATPLIMEYLQKEGLMSEEGEFTGSEDELKSINASMMKRTLEYTPDQLLKQLVLTKNTTHALQTGQPGIELYEKNVDILDKYITLPYLRKPLHDLYLSTKDSF